MSKLDDLTGKRFGRLVVLRKDTENYDGINTRWVCKCDCGNITSQYRQGLINGKIKSCGCYAREQTIKRSTIHGKSYDRIYSCWRSMIDRCKNKNSHAYKYYGGRGIEICKQWDNFKNFYEWAMSHGYTDKLSIDRIDVNGNYCPENCRWATTKEQANNKRGNKFVEIDGVRKTVAEWSIIFNIKPVTVYSRIRHGWDEIKAITTPAHKYNHHNTASE